MVTRELSVSKYTKVFRTVLESVGMSNNVIKGYDDVIDSKIPSIIDNDRLIHHLSGKTATFKNTRLVLENPSKKPAEYRENKENYLLKILTTVKLGGTEKEISLGTIPCMLGSRKCILRGKNKEELFALGECPYDPHGYFIIKNEKVVIIQEQLRNSIFLTYLQKGEAQTRMTCPCVNGTMVMEMFQDTAKGSSNNTILLNIPSFRSRPIDIFVIFYIYDIDPVRANEMILSFVPESEHLECTKIILPSFIVIKDFLRKKEKLTNRDEIKRVALDEIATSARRPNMTLKEYMKEMDQNVFPQIEGSENKMIHLAMMIAQHARFLIGKRPADNRDSWSNKRLITAGQQIKKLFAMIWEKQKEKWLEGSDINIGTFQRTELITKNFIGSMNPNRWGYAKSQVKDNIVEILRRDTEVAILNQISRVNTPSSRNMKLSSVRMVDGNQYGIICPYESPEGDTIGLVKNLACICTISLERNPDTILDYLNENFSNRLSASRENGFIYPVCINGILQCYTDEGILLANRLRKARRLQQIPHDTCVFWCQKDFQLQIYCDAERPLHPMFVVNKETGQLLIDEMNSDDIWDASLEELMRRGLIDFVDAREQEFSLLYTRATHFHTLPMEKAIKYDYCSIDPQDQFSIMATTAPKANMEQCPRISYQAGMSRQALGPYAINRNSRFDGSAFKVLRTPTRPFFELETAKCMGLNNMPTGQSLTFAFFSRPWNQEDGIELNKNTYDQDLQYWKYISFEARLSLISGKDDHEISKIPNHSRYTEKLYHAIDPISRLPRIGAYINEKDCILPKVRCDAEERDTSIYAGVGENGYVDRIYVKASAGYVDVKIRLCKLRQYTLGAKMAARYAQKGVICKHTNPLSSEMPFIIGGPNHGATVDVLANAHSIPSRMTVGELIEITASKYAAQTGEYINGSSFKLIIEGNEVDTSASVQEILNRQMAKKISKKLEERGMNGTGVERMAYHNDDGTITLIKEPINVGILYYQCLKHHAEDKVQYRGENGNLNILTHQPNQGRQKEGGLRFGEMERDAVVCHGSEALTLEKLCYVSDKYNLVLCYNCGVVPTNNTSDYSYRCKRCGGNDFCTVIIPYPIKLLTQVLGIAGINMRFDLKYKTE